MWYHMHIPGYEMYHMHVPGYEMHQIFSAEQVLGIHRKLVWSVCTSSLCLAPRKMLALLINQARASVRSYNYAVRNLISDTSSSNIFQARRQNGITQAFHLLRLWKILRASLNLIISCGLQFRSLDQYICWTKIFISAKEFLEVGQIKRIEEKPKVVRGADKQNKLWGGGTNKQTVKTRWSGGVKPCENISV